MQSYGVPNRINIHPEGEIYVKMSMLRKSIQYLMRCLTETTTSLLTKHVNVQYLLATVPSTGISTPTAVSRAHPTTH